jgi:hypothetical protein
MDEAERPGRVVTGIASSAWPPETMRTEPEGEGASTPPGAWCRAVSGRAGGTERLTARASVRRLWARLSPLPVWDVRISDPLVGWRVCVRRPVIGRWRRIGVAIRIVSIRIRRGRGRIVDGRRRWRARNHGTQQGGGPKARQHTADNCARPRPTRSRRGLCSDWSCEPDSKCCYQAT